MDMKNKGLFTSKTDDWATPQKFFDDLNRVYNFQLDVCASHSNHKCACYYTVEDDGLKSHWRNNVSINRWVWMNPPYGREIGKWVKKQQRVDYELWLFYPRGPIQSGFTSTFTDPPRFSS